MDPYAAFKAEEILDVLIYMAIHGVTSKNGAKGFRKEYKRGLSPRTIRDRLGKLGYSKVKEAFMEANNKILSYFEEKNMFKSSLLIANDISHVLCYGKHRKICVWYEACGMKRLNQH